MRKYARHPRHAGFALMMGCLLLGLAVWERGQNQDVWWMLCVLALLYAFWAYASPFIVWQADDTLVINRGLLTKNTLSLRRISQVELKPNQLHFYLDDRQRLSIPLAQLHPSARIQFLKNIREYVYEYKGLDIL